MYYVIEWVVFELCLEGLVLMEIVFGIDFECDILVYMDFYLVIVVDFQVMDS